MKKVSLILSALVMTALLVTSFGDSGYKEVTIGKQVWMTENLNVDKFRNGDPIPYAKNQEEWEKAGKNGQPAWCYYNNDPAYGLTYGKLYNWYAVNDTRGLAPKGYHIPTDTEWTILEKHLGQEAGKKMKSKSGWKENGNSSNISGFSALPGGFRSSNGSFYLISYSGYWWSSTEYGTSLAYDRFLYYFNDVVYKHNGSKKDGLSVRCLRD